MLIKQSYGCLSLSVFGANKYTIVCLGHYHSDKDHFQKCSQHMSLTTISLIVGEFRGACRIRMPMHVELRTLVNFFWYFHTSLFVLLARFGTF